MNNFAWISYTTEWGGKGFARLDQIAGIEEAVDKSGTFVKTWIGLASGKELCVKESAEDLMKAITNG